MALNEKSVEESEFDLGQLDLDYYKDLSQNERSEVFKRIYEFHEPIVKETFKKWDLSWVAIVGDEVVAVGTEQDTLSDRQIIIFENQYNMVCVIYYRPETFLDEMSEEEKAQLRDVDYINKVVRAQVSEARDSKESGNNTDTQKPIEYLVRLLDDAMERFQTENN
ncbi:hypothetical protein GF354_04730 [Candidatus Peregrinibacteria bacterium]|nr:hypothetical protein [Candidatus Peregrinibacteria bacterium]